MPLTLCYWDSKGWAEPSRLLLHIFKVDYQEVTWPGFAGWFAKRDEVFTDPVKTPFPHVPILIDGDFVLSQHQVIHNYLIKKYNRLDLLGKTLQEETRVRQIDAICTEVHTAVIFKGLLAEDYEAFLTKAFKEDGQFANAIKSFSGFLADKDFFVGYLTLADLRATYELKYIRNAALSLGLEDPIVGKYDNLVALIKRVEALPELEGYYGGPRDYKYTPDDLGLWYKEYPLEE